LTVYHAYFAPRQITNSAQIQRISPSYHETELAMEQLDHYSPRTEQLTDERQIVLTRGGIQNMRGCKIGGAITNSD
jgi:hypothetical protein